MLRHLSIKKKKKMIRKKKREDTTTWDQNRRLSGARRHSLKENEQSLEVLTRKLRSWGSGTESREINTALKRVPLGDKTLRASNQGRHSSENTTGKACACQLPWITSETSLKSGLPTLIYAGYRVGHTRHPPFYFIYSFKENHPQTLESE